MITETGMRTSNSINIGFKSMTILLRVRLSNLFLVQCTSWYDGDNIPLHFLTAVEPQISLSDSDLSKIGETQNPWHNSKITEVMKPFAVFLIIYVFDYTSAVLQMFCQRSFLTSLSNELMVNYAAEKEMNKTLMPSLQCDH